MGRRSCQVQSDSQDSHGPPLGPGHSGRKTQSSTCQQGGIRHRSYTGVLATVHSFGVQRDEAAMWQMCKQALTAGPHSLAGAVISRARLVGTSQGTCQLQEPPMKPQQGLTLVLIVFQNRCKFLQPGIDFTISNIAS